MKLSQIRDVLAVAETGSLRAAARRLGIAQPTITRSIGEIERELGAALFARLSKGVTLTPVGQAVVRRALTVEAELRRLRDDVAQLRGSENGLVSAALSVASSMALLPRALTIFRRQYPDAQVHIAESLFQPVQQEIVDGRTDFYLGALSLPVVAPGLSIEKLFDNEKVVVGRRGHPLLAGRRVEDLANAYWARPTTLDRSNEADFLDMLGEIGLPDPRIVVHLRSALQTLLAVASSDLLTVVPRQWLEIPELIDGLVAFPHVHPFASAPICLVRQASISLTPIAQHLCDVLCKVASNYARGHVPAPVSDSPQSSSGGGRRKSETGSKAQNA